MKIQHQSGLQIEIHGHGQDWRCELCIEGNALSQGQGQTRDAAFAAACYALYRQFAPRMKPERKGDPS